MIFLAKLRKLYETPYNERTKVPGYENNSSLFSLTCLRRVRRYGVSECEIFFKSH